MDHWFLYALSRALQDHLVGDEVLDRLETLERSFIRRLTAAEEGDRRSLERALEVLLSPEQRAALIGGVPYPESEEQAEAGWRYVFDAPDAFSDVVQPAWLVEDILRERTFALLIGVPGVSKSTLASDLALTVALGCENTSAHVIVIAFEGETALHEARRAFEAQHGVQVRHVRYINRQQGAASLSLLDGAAVDALIRDVTPYEPRLIVIDAYARVLGETGNENDAHDAARVVSACERIVRLTGSALLLIAHTNKGGVSLRGSNGLTAGADLEMLLTEEDGGVILRCGKTRNGAPPFMARRFRRVDMTARGVPWYVLLPGGGSPDVTGRLTGNQERILEYLGSAAIEIMGGARHADVGDGTGIAKSSVNMGLSALVKRGLVTRGKGRMYQVTESGLKWLAAGEEAHGANSGSAQGYNWGVSGLEIREA